MGSPLMSPHELTMKRYEVGRSSTGSGVGDAIGLEPNASAEAMMNARVARRVGPKVDIDLSRRRSSGEVTVHLVRRLHESQFDQHKPCNSIKGSKVPTDMPCYHLLIRYTRNLAHYRVWQAQSPAKQPATDIRYRAGYTYPGERTTSFPLLIDYLAITNRREARALDAA